MNFALDAKVSPVHVTVTGPAARLTDSAITMMLLANDAVDAAVFTPQKVVNGLTLEMTATGNDSVICPPTES